MGVCWGDDFHHNWTRTQPRGFFNELPDEPFHLDESEYHFDHYPAICTRGYPVYSQLPVEKKEHNPSHW